MIINANQVLYLNRTAADHVRLLLEGLKEDEIWDEMRKRYRVSRQTVVEDNKKVLFAINSLVSRKDVCPISYLGIDKIEPFSRDLSAPLRADLAITYKCNNRCIHCYSSSPSVIEELDSAQWTVILRELFEIGIPQVLFTGGEPTMRDDLPELISQTQDLGLVSGLVTNGRKLSDPGLVERLASSGLDYAQITLESHDPKIHDEITETPGSWKETVDGIENVVRTSIYMSVNMTLNRRNVSEALKVIDFLHSLGVKHFACNGLIHAGRGTEVGDAFELSEGELGPTLVAMRDRAKGHGMEFNWYTPTRYCKLNPVNLGLGIRSCSAAKTTICIEPDGGVIPCQSYYKRMGNILTDDWGKIWNHPLSRHLRSRGYATEECKRCSQFSVCGAACPLEMSGEERKIIPHSEHLGT